MPYNQIFNESEWESLEMCFIFVFQKIANSDGRIELEELDNMSYIINHASKFDCELTKAVFESLNRDFTRLMNMYNVENDEIDSGIRKAAAIVDEKIEDKDAACFKKSVMAVACFVSDPKGKPEAKAIDELSSMLNLSEEQKEDCPTLHEMIDQLKGR